MKSIYLFILCFCCGYSQMNAETYVYFQNNTNSSFTVDVTQYGTHIMSPGEWGTTNTNVPAWKPNLELMWTNRNSGVHNGDDFFFDIRVKTATDTITLKVKLKGTFASSDLWQAASGPGFSHPWYQDRNFHESTFMMAGKTYTLKYEAYATGGYDDILFALQEHEPFPFNYADTANADVLNVFAYNLFMLTPPVSFSQQNERAAEIPNHIHNYDVIFFSEAFHNNARNVHLIPGIQAEYPYYTPVIDEVGSSNEDGGVFIASRFPIDTFIQYIFQNCDGTDCLASKGFMYAKIDKLGRKYHVFATHMQSFNDTPAKVQNRILQFGEVRSFLDSLNIPANEPVLYGGDLNVDLIVNNMNEYYGMIDSMNFMVPTYTGHPYTYDVDFNQYASTGHEYLDYVFPMDDYESPVQADNQVVILRSIVDDSWDKFDLSDHFGIHGHFVFSPITAIEEVEEEIELEQTLAAIKIYPNPNNGRFIIENEDLTTDFEELSIQLVDALGQTVYRDILYNNEQKTIDLGQDIPAGIYFLNVHNEQEAKTYKVMIQR